MERMLIVEDSDFFAKLVTKVLAERLQCHVDRVATYAEAREYMENYGDSIFAALLDLHLPDSPHGEIVDHFATLNIPSIVFTGEINEEVRDIIMSKNVVDYVLKEGPGSLDALVDSLQRLKRNSDITVLVADDSDTARSMVARLLRTHQYNVLEAKNGQAALDLLDLHPEIILLITDFHMPGMDGFELVHRVRKTRTRENLSIIGMSAELNPLMSAKFIKSGANDFLRKPFLVEEFHCRIDLNIELIRSIATIRDLAEKDHLTGLHNRRYFFQRATGIYKESESNGLPLLAAMLDIDHFKKVNDTYGHDAGDAVLVAVAEQLKTHFARFGLVCRFGGEEFCVLLPGMSLAQGQRAFEAFRKELEVIEVLTPTGPVSVTVSIGLNIERSQSLDSMLKCADDALYTAKNDGRNRVEVCAQCGLTE